MIRRIIVSLFVAATVTLVGVTVAFNFPNARWLGVILLTPADYFVQQLERFTSIAPYKSVYTGLSLAILFWAAIVFLLDGSVRSLRRRRKRVA